MYNLFSFKKLFELSKSNDAKILDYSYVETSYWSLCALATSNGFIIFYYVEYNGNKSAPIIRQIPWLHHPYKHIKSICFDPYHKCWLAIVTEDATLYILPALTIVKPYATIEQVWSIEDITECNLRNKKSPPTCVTWWRTSEHEPIAIIGHELGEITFVNLHQLQEIGATFIPVAVSNLQILQNSHKNKTFLLITSVTDAQWFLLIEDVSSLFFWPGEADFFSAHSSGYDGHSGNMCTSQTSGADMLSSTDLQPERIMKYEGIGKLVVHNMCNETVVSVTSAQSSCIKLLDYSLKEINEKSQVQLPSQCAHYLICDKLIFCLSSQEDKAELSVISYKLCEQNQQEKVKDNNPESALLQHFNFDASPKILAIISIVDKPEQDEDNHSELNSSSAMSTIMSKTSISIASSQRTASSVKNVRKNATMQCKAIHGCIIVTTTAMYICRQQNQADQLIFELLCANDQSAAAMTDNLKQAQKLASALQINIQRIYGDAADHHLSCARFPEALRLLQLSQCPQLKRVATFASQGCLGELLTYIRMLFSSNIIDIAAADRRHFANIIVHCFVHQLLDNQANRTKLLKAFWTFLDLNGFYDDEVALRLLIDHGLYDSVYHLVQIHGLYDKMLELILSKLENSISGYHGNYENHIKQALEQLQCHSVLSHISNEHFLKCISMKQLCLTLLMNPDLVTPYLSLVGHILAKVTNCQVISKLVIVLDFTQLTCKFFLHKASHKYRKSLKSHSHSSLMSAASNTLDFVSTTCSTDINVRDLAETLIWCLLRLNRDQAQHFDMELLNLSCDQHGGSYQSVPANEQVHCKPTIISCGAAHAALVRNGCVYTWGKTKNGRLGHDISPSKLEKMPPKMVGLLLRHRITVHSVSCGAQHTLALTSHGIYAWGSSCFGQLGLGDILRSTQPIVIEDFVLESITSVVCGQYHSLALTSDGRLFSWGWGVHGQLGHANAHNLSHPKQIDPASIGGIAVEVSAGHSHTLVLNGLGHVYSFGCGLFGQLGLGNVRKQTSPCKINLPEPVSMLATGFFHSIALTCNNRLFTWGMNPQTLKVQAQIIKKMRGHKHQMHHQPTLKEIASAEKDLNESHLVPVALDTSQIESPIKYVCCGGAHTALLTVHGEVFTWGRNFDGQLGIGSRKEMRTPSLLISINDRRMVDISCGPDYTIAMDSTGRLWGWGRNNVGQLGIEEPEPIVAMDKVPQAPIKVVKLRSAKRMIQLRQGRSSEILKPVELIWLPQSVGYEAQRLYTDDTMTGGDMLMLDPPVLDLPVLYDIEKPAYGVKTLHLALEHLYEYYNSSSVIHHCISADNLQATAKVCMLEGAYHKAIVYQLQSVQNLPNVAQCVAHIVNSYVRQMEQQPISVQNSIIFVEHLLKFWMKHELCTNQLESMLSCHSQSMYTPTALLLFGCTDNQGNGLVPSTLRNIDSILTKMSAQFCFSLASHLIAQIECGSLDPQYSQQIVGSMTFKLIANNQTLSSSWNPTLQSQDLWQVILQNLTKDYEPAIVLGSSAVSAMHRSIASETSATSNAYFDESFVAFTCGHHFSTHQYRTVVIPNFEQGLHKLSANIPQTIQLMMSLYDTEDVSGAACPRCALASLQQQMPISY